MVSWSDIEQKKQLNIICGLVDIAKEKRSRRNYTVNRRIRPLFVLNTQLSFEK